LRNAEIKPAELDLIGVTVGPGSFTGIRIGLAFARGLALALDKPLAARTTFDAVADAVPPDERDEQRHPARRLIAAIDSKRDEIFMQLLDGAAAAHDGAACRRSRALRAARYGLIGDAAPEVMLAFAALKRHQECVVLPAPRRGQRLCPVWQRRAQPIWREHNRREGLPRPYYLRAPDVTLGASTSPRRPMTKPSLIGVLRRARFGSRRLYLRRGLFGALEQRWTPGFCRVAGHAGRLWPDGPSRTQGHT